MAGPGTSPRLRILLPLIALLLLTGPGPTASGEEECDPVSSVQTPQVAARDGTPVVIAVRLAPCALLDHHEVRGWLGNATHQASRIHDGDGWSTSQHYAPLEGLARQDGFHLLALQANPGSTHAGPLIEQASSTQAWLRLRGANTTDPVPLGTIDWVDEDQVVPYWDTPGPALFVEQDGVLLGSTLQGADKDGHPLPPGFARLALPEGTPAGPAAPVGPGDLLLVRMIPRTHEGGSMIEFIVGDNVDDLQGLRMVSRSGTIVLPSMPVAPGSLVRLTDQPDESVAPLQDHLPGLGFPEPVVVTWGEEEGEKADGTNRAETVTGRFQFAQSGGMVHLEYGDVVLDSFAYGETDAPPVWEGESVEATRIAHRVYLREHDGDAFIDSDTASDWQRPRIHRQHQSDLETRWFTVEGPVRAFVCPDRCHEEVLLRIEQAQVSIDANLYELTLPSVVASLADAATRGVEVRVLVHDRPVGASTFRMDRVAWAVDELLEAGAQVRTLDGTRYDVNHAKYLVVDDAWTTVLTENAVSSGWPSDGATGNRGHGVSVHDPELAAWATTLFETDHLHPVDARDTTGDDLHEDRQPYRPTDSSLHPPRPDSDRLPTLVVEESLPVAPVVAPDHLGDPLRNPIVDILHQAQHEIGLAQMNLPLHWSRAGYTQDSPLADALVAAAQDGVQVTGTLADAFIDDPERDGNHRTAAALHVADERIDLRLAGGPDDEGIVHAKTWWTDPGKPTGVAATGSANGNLASQAMNRELTLILAHGGIAAYWAAVGSDDHAQGTHFSAYAPLPRDEETTTTKAPSLPLPLVVFSLIAATLALVGTRKSPPPDPL